MDIALTRTFLEVAATGSFVAAATRLYVTQSAVSLRIRKLEESLGATLFTRSKAGAELTPAGREFERYALAMLKVWEEARQQVAVPEGFARSLHLGAQYSLWPRLGFRWMDEIRAAAPDVALRAELGMPDRLTRFLVEGVTQMALLYTPQLRPGLDFEKAMEEELILVAAFPDPDLARLTGRYVFVDWGPEFLHAHALRLPDLTHAGVTLALGAMARDYVEARGLAAYLPAHAARAGLAAGRLHVVPDAPVFPYPAWAVWREDIEDELREAALTALRAAAATVDAEQHAVMDEVAAHAEDGALERLDLPPFAGD